MYWSLYRVGRWHTPALTRHQSWQWYLRRAHKTAMALWTCGGDPWTKKVGGGIGTTQWGLMVVSAAPFQPRRSNRTRLPLPPPLATTGPLRPKPTAALSHMPSPTRKHTSIHVQGSIFELLLSDLMLEGWTSEAEQLQLTVEKRMAVWLKMPFPYGSEFSWDSTGHEEISVCAPPDPRNPRTPGSCRTSSVPLARTLSLRTGRPPRAHA